MLQSGRELFPYLALAGVFLSACTSPMTATPNEADLIYTAAVQTLRAELTQGAAATRAPASTAAILATESSSPEPTQTGISTETTPSPTLPEPTATQTPTPTLSIPMITATRATNCRFGPSRAFDVLGYLLPGQKVEVRGRLSGGGWWYIQNPDRPTQSCWVWDQTTEVEGDVSPLPFITPPPTPTPSITPTATIEVTVTPTNTQIPDP